jgi:hypothetical protein
MSGSDPGKDLALPMSPGSLQDRKSRNSIRIECPRLVTRIVPDNQRSLCDHDQCNRMDCDA